MTTLRTFLLFVLVAIASPRDALAQFTIPGSTTVAVTPGQGSAGVTIVISASNLRVGTSYSVSLVGSFVDQTLVPAAAATATSRSWKVAVPSVTPGKYSIVLEAGARSPAATTPFVVAPSLTVTASTNTPQAGKGILVTVGNLASGSLRLVYGNRIVYGPAAVAAGTAPLAGTGILDVWSVDIPVPCRRAPVKAPPGPNDCRCHVVCPLGPVWPGPTPDRKPD